jgi:hypothetical protein
MRKLYDGYLTEWSENCVDGPDYTRHGKLFNRHVPWMEKEYRKATGKKGLEFEPLYRDVVGSEPPVGLFKAKKNIKK